MRGREAHNCISWSTLTAKRQHGLPQTTAGQKQLSDKEHRERGGVSAQAAPQECERQWWGLVPGDSSEGCPPAPRQGVRDALGTIQSITGDNSDNEGTQQHSVVANSWQWPLRCKSVCIIISWVCMLESCHIWFPEEGLSLYFSSFLWR